MADIAAPKRRESIMQRSCESLRSLDQGFREDGSEVFEEKGKHDIVPEDNHTLSSDKGYLNAENAEDKLHRVVCLQNVSQKVQHLLAANYLDDASKICFYTGLPSVGVDGNFLS